MQGRHYDEDTSDSGPVDGGGSVVLVASQTGLVTAEDLYRDTYFNPNNEDMAPLAGNDVQPLPEDDKDVKTFVV